MPRTKASDEVAGAGGVAAGVGTGAVAAGADVVALVSVTSTAADLYALGTLKNFSGSFPSSLFNFILELLNCTLHLCDLQV